MSAEKLQDEDRDATGLGCDTHSDDRARTLLSAPPPPATAAQPESRRRAADHALSPEPAVVRPERDVR